MKNKDQILSMLFAKFTEYKIRLDWLNNEASGDMLINWGTTIVSHLSTEIHLLCDILGDDIPEEYGEELEKYDLL